MLSYPKISASVEKSCIIILLFIILNLSGLQFILINKSDFKKIILDHNKKFIKIILLTNYLLYLMKILIIFQNINFVKIL